MMQWIYAGLYHGNTAGTADRYAISRNDLSIYEQDCRNSTKRNAHPIPDPPKVDAVLVVPPW